MLGPVLFVEPCWLLENLLASPAVWICTVKLDEENPTYAGMAQENGFGSAELQTLPWLVKGAAALCTSIKECNKYDLICCSVLLIAHHNDWSKWFAINRPPLICCPSFTFRGGVAKEYRTKLECEKYFRRVTYWASLEMLLPRAQTHEHVHKVLLYPIAWPKLMNMFIKRYRCPFPKVGSEVLSQHFVLECFPHSLNFRKRRTLPADTNVHTKMPFTYRVHYRVHSSMYWYLPDLPKHVLILLDLVNYSLISKPFWAFSHLYHIGVEMISTRAKTCKILWVSKDSEKGSDCFKLIDQNYLSMCDIICSVVLYSFIFII